MKNVIKTSFIMIIICFVIASCGSNKRSENTLTVASLYQPNTLSTTLNSEAVNSDIINNIFAGLLTYDVDGQLIGAMAEKWEVSENRLTYTFYLRDGVLWSNGTPVTAQDFVFAWRLLASTDAPYRTLLVDIQNGRQVIDEKLPVDQLGVNAKDEKTLVVTLESPKIYFEKLMAFGAFFPINETFYNEVGADNYGTSKETILENGPFLLESYDPAFEYVLVKNPDYWESNAISLEKVVTRIVAEPATQTSMYEKGEIDRLQLNADQIDQFEGSDEMIQFVEGRTAYLYLSGNTETESEVLSNKNFRKAVSYAIDKTVITDRILKNGSLPSDYLIPKDFDTINGVDFREYSGRHNDLQYSPEKAQEYLAKAKSELGQENVEFELVYRETDADKKVNENIKSQIETNLPGVAVTLQMLPQAQYYPELYNYATPAANSGWGADYVDVASFYSIFRSFDDNNFGRYNSAEFDRLVEEAEQQTTPEARWDKFAEAEDVLIDDSENIFLYQRGSTVLVKPYVKGYKVNPFLSEATYKYISIEE